MPLPMFDKEIIAVESEEIANKLVRELTRMFKDIQGLNLTYSYKKGVGYRVIATKPGGFAEQTIKNMERAVINLIPLNGKEK